MIIAMNTAASAYLSSSESRNPPKAVVCWQSLARVPSSASQKPEASRNTVARRRYSLLVCH